VCHAIEPLDAIKDSVDQVIEILKAPEFQDDNNKDAQKKAIWEEVRKIFDFDEMSRRTTAQYWKIFSQDEKQEFSVLFSELLGNTYLDKIQKYSDEKIIYVSQENLDETKSLVETKLVRKDIDIPISYSMYKTNGMWKVYDVKIEGVSLVQNYRAQFTKVLINKKPAVLIEMLRNKISE
jgi:phospholipid transport system substrate-binding protein